MDRGDAEYDWGQFMVHMHYRAPIERVFAAWATPAGLQSFFLEAAIHRGPEGDERGGDALTRSDDRFEWTWLHAAKIEGRIIECEPPRRIVFTFGTKMRVEVALREIDDDVELRLHQTGCADEPQGRVKDHLNCRSCWVYYLTNLKSVLEHGTDLRDREHPAWNDSVAVHWKP